MSKRELKQQRRRRTCLFAVSCLYTPLFVGSVFGWGPLQLLLEENGSFSHKCNGDEQGDHDEICAAQTASLLNVNLSAMLTQLASPLLGWIVDKYGARIAFYMMAAFTWCGLALMMVAVNGIDWLLYIAFSVLSLNTWFGGLISIQTGLYFQGHTRSRVIFALNALFDAGAITYLGLWAINKLLNNFTLLLGLYTALAVLVYGSGLYFWTVAVPEEPPEDIANDLSIVEKGGDPTNTTHTATVSSSNLKGEEPLLGPPEAGQDKDETKDDESLENEGIICSDDGENERNSSTVEIEPLPDVARTDVSNDHSVSNCFVPVNQRTQKEQMLSGPYFLLYIYFVLHVVANQFNLATARDFLAYLGDDDYGNKYLTIFTLLTPASICGVPFVDRVLLRYGFHGGFQVVNMLALTYHLIKVSSDNLNVQILGFIAFSFFRSFFFGITFSFLQPCCRMMWLARPRERCLLVQQCFPSSTFLWPILQSSALTATSLFPTWYIRFWSFPVSLWHGGWGIILTKSRV